jgi:hypothetical protein
LPELSVRNVPVEPAVVLMTVPDPDAAAGLPLPAAGAELAAEPLLLELPHAAASSAAATGTPSFTGMGIRVSNELTMCISPSWAGARRRPSACCCRHIYGRRAERD